MRLQGSKQDPFQYFRNLDDISEGITVGILAKTVQQMKQPFT